MRYGARRRRSVNRTRPGLRRNHASLRNDWLARRRLGRNRWNCGLGRNRGCGFGNRGRCRRFRRWRCYRCRRLLRLHRWRCDHHRGRRGWLFDLLLDWRSRRRRNNRRCLTRRRNHHGPLRYGRLDNRLFRDWRRGCSRLRCHRWRCLRFCRRWCGRLGCGRRPGRGCWMLGFLLPLFQQPHHIARLGNLGEIDFRPDLLRRSLPGGGAGFGGKVLPDLFRFIRFNRA